jgi:hypothetical protein
MLSLEDGKWTHMWAGIERRSIRGPGLHCWKPERTTPRCGRRSGGICIIKVMSEKLRTQLCRIWCASIAGSDNSIGTLTRSWRLSNCVAESVTIRPSQKWVEEDYFWAIQQLAETGIAQFHKLKEVENVRAVLSILALAKGARAHAKFLVEYGEDELLEMESKL